MSEFEPTPMRGGSRFISQVAISLAILAGTIFIVVIVLGSGGSQRVAAVFGPIGVGVTIVGLIAAVTAVSLKRSRTLGLISLLVLVPSVFLSFFAVVALLSR